MSRTDRRASGPIRAACALLALLPGIGSAAAQAEKRAVEALVGCEGDNRGQGYGFAGAGIVWPASATLSVPFRALGSYLYYDFTSGGETTRVSSPGVSLMAGIRLGASQYLYGRTAIRCQVTNIDWQGPRSFFLGLEVLRQGNDESDAVQAGGFGEWNFVAHRLSLILRGGYKEHWSPGEEHVQGGYAALGFYHRF